MRQGAGDLGHRITAHAQYRTGAVIFERIRKSRKLHAATWKVGSCNTRSQILNPQEGLGQGKPWLELWSSRLRLRSGVFDTLVERGSVLFQLGNPNMRLLPESIHRQCKASCGAHAAHVRIKRTWPERRDSLGPRLRSVPKVHMQLHRTSGFCCDSWAPRRGNDLSV